MSFFDLFKTRKIAFTLILVLTLTSIIFGVLATQPYGAGVAGDSIIYLSTAENLLAGRGFVDNTNAPLVSFPPLLVLIFAGLSWLFNADVFFVAWFFTLFLLGINTALGSLWLYHFFREQPAYFVIGSLFLTVSISNLRMHTAILSDPLYLTFTLLFFFFGWQYLEKQTTASFLGMLVLGILSPILRFSGLSQVAAAGLIVLYVHRKQWISAFGLGAILGIFSILPIGLWIYCHNYLVHNTFWGSVNGNVDFLENLLQGLRKILYWFAPYRPLSPNGLLDPLFVLLALTLALSLFNRKKDWVAWFKSFQHPALSSMMLFSFIYFISTTANIISQHHTELDSDRYYVMIMLPILVLIFSILERLVLPHVKFSSKHIWSGIFIMFVLWSTYPVSRIDKYIRHSQAGMWHNYNVFNTREYHQSQILAEAKALLAQEPDALVYSNVPHAAWFYLRHPIKTLPRIQREWGAEEIAQVYKGWPAQPGHLLWLNNDPYERFRNEDFLNSQINMTLLVRADDGRIYSISPLK